jgi:hypothetical protein
VFDKKSGEKLNLFSPLYVSIGREPREEGALIS